MGKSKLQNQKDKHNSKYWREKADGLFMGQFRGMPCEICNETNGTCGHHLIGKRRAKALRYDRNNIVVLCPAHHTMGNDIAPHSLNHIAVERFVVWLKENKPLQRKWIQENMGIERRFTHKQAFENMKAGKEAWEI